MHLNTHSPQGAVCVAMFTNCGTSVIQTGESLIDASHYASDEIEANVERVLVRWDDLRQALEARGRGLEEALSLVQFKHQVDEVHAMISDRVSGGVGEGCQSRVL